MRTKTRQTLLSSGSLMTTTTDSTRVRRYQPPGPYPNVEQVKTFETISYSTNAKRDRSNGCTASKLERSYSDFTLCEMGCGNASLIFTSPTEWHWLPFEASDERKYVAYFPGFPSFTPYPTDLLNNDIAIEKNNAADQTILDTANSRVNIVQSALELKDLKKINLDGLKSLRGLTKRMLEEGVPRAKILLMTLGELCSIDLMIKYGIEPTVKDWSSVWAPLFTGDLSASVALRGGEYLRCAYSVPFHDNRHEGFTPASVIGQVYTGTGMISGSTHYAGQKFSKLRGLEVEALMSSANAFLTRADSIVASGVVYCKTVPSPNSNLTDDLNRAIRDRARYLWLSGLWEVTPLSFVLDWGINVGEWIRSNELHALTLGYTLHTTEGLWATTKVENICYASYPTVNVSSTFNGNYRNETYEISHGGWLPYDRTLSFVREPYRWAPTHPRVMTLQGFVPSALLELFLANIKLLI